MKYCTPDDYNNRDHYVFKLADRYPLHDILEVMSQLQHDNSYTVFVFRTHIYIYIATNGTLQHGPELDEISMYLALTLNADYLGPIK